MDPETSQNTDNKELDIVKTTYRKQFDDFKTTFDIIFLVMFNANTDRLQKIREEYAVLYTE